MALCSIIRGVTCLLKDYLFSIDLHTILLKMNILFKAICISAFVTFVLSGDVNGNENHVNSQPGNSNGNSHSHAKVKNQIAYFYA